MLSLSALTSVEGVTTTQLGDATIAYDDSGPGHTGISILLVHGHPFDRTMWRPQAARLARDGYRVVVPDLRGYGESKTTASKTGLEVFADDLIRLADHLGIYRFVLGGLSMGGQIVMQTIAVHPERVSALLLADTFPGVDTPEARQHRLDTADRIEEEGMAGLAEELLPKMISPKTLKTRPDVVAHVREMMTTAPAEGAAAALRGRAERPDYTGSLIRIKVPTLVAVGSEDEFTPVNTARLMHRLVPGSTLAVIDGAGHLPNLECEAEFNDALGHFLMSTSLTSTSLTSIAPTEER